MHFKRTYAQNLMLIRHIYMTLMLSYERLVNHGSFIHYGVSKAKTFRILFSYLIFFYLIRYLPSMFTIVKNYTYNLHFLFISWLLKELYRSSFLWINYCSKSQHMHSLFNSVVTKSIDEQLLF